MRKQAGDFGDADPMVAVMLASRWFFYFFTVEKCFGAPLHFGMTPKQAVGEFIRLLRFGLLPREPPARALPSTTRSRAGKASGAKSHDHQVHRQEKGQVMKHLAQAEGVGDRSTSRPLAAGRPLASPRCSACPAAGWRAGERSARCDDGGGRGSAAAARTRRPPRQMRESCRRQGRRGGGRWSRSARRSSSPRASARRTCRRCRSRSPRSPGDRLEETAAADISELQGQVPNLSIYEGRNQSTTLTAFIRGIGQADPLWGVDPGVGLYIDDVYVARPQGALLDVYDVQRIEVLRGPQGTLYGKNTIGGAIKYVSRPLTDDTSGD